MVETLNTSAFVAVVGPTFGTVTSFSKKPRSTPRKKPINRGIGAFWVTK